MTQTRSNVSKFTTFDFFVKVASHLKCIQQSLSELKSGKEKALRIMCNQIEKREYELNFHKTETKLLQSDIDYLKDNHQLQKVKDESLNEVKQKRLQLLKNQVDESLKKKVRSIAQGNYNDVIKYIEYLVNIQYLTHLPSIDILLKTMKTTKPSGKEFVFYNKVLLKTIGISNNNFINKLLKKISEIKSGDRSVHFGDCGICYSGKPEYAFIPCGHSGLCSICAKKILSSNSKKCPFCNRVVKSFLKTYDSAVH